MSENQLGISVNIGYKLEKYADDVSQEDIDSGRATPYEVIDHIDEAKITREQALALGLIKG
jgi:hypothetical protein